MFAIDAEAIRDLHGQFARRRQHEHARATALGLRRIGQVVQKRQGEGRGFSGSGLGAPEQIAPLHDERNGLHLNGRGRGVTFGRDGAQNRVAQSKHSERVRMGRGRDRMGSGVVVNLGGIRT